MRRLLPNNIRTYLNIYHKTYMMSKRKATTKPIAQKNMATKKRPKKEKPPPPQPKSTMKDDEFVYLVWPIRFMEQRQNVYKLGKTTGHNCRNRFSGYDKGSRIKLIWNVPDCDIAEKHLLAEFRERYKARTDVGAEYFQGDVNQMKTTFLRVVETYPEPEINPGWIKWMWNGVRKRMWF